MLRMQRRPFNEQCNLVKKKITPIKIVKSRQCLGNLLASRIYANCKMNKLVMGLKFIAGSITATQKQKLFVPKKNSPFFGLKQT
jgi:hypothetical protein